ncbi:MAG: diguanylate cyclase [Chromatiales bacterium]|nr:diguanylate cyclase [Chromatiales bacterium]
MKSLSPHLLGRLLEVSPLGMLVADFRDDGLPIVYVNQALAKMLKVTPDSLIGKGLLSLAMPDPPPPDGWMLQEQLQLGESASLLLVLPSSAGTDVQLRLVPMAGTGDRFSHVAGYIPPESLVAAGNSTPWRVATGSTVKLDRLTGLPSLDDFSRSLALSCAHADSSGESVSLIMLRVNHYNLYQDTFGAQAAASMMRLVARSIAGTLRRSSDRLARSGKGEFVLSVEGLNETQVKALATRLAERVRNLSIHHPKSTISRYVSLRSSALRAEGDSSVEQLFARAREELDKSENSELPPIPRL